MLIALHRDTDYEECIADIWAEYLTNHGVEIRWVDLLGHDTLDQVHGCDGVMWRWGHKPTDKLAAYRILHSIEMYLGIPVFPDHRTCWHYDEKLSQYYLLKAAGIPTPKTWVFWEKDKALKWANETDYPKVFKLSCGASGSNVVKVSNAEEACRLIDRMFGPGIYDGHIKGRPGAISRSSWRNFKSFTQRYKAATRYVIDGRPVWVPGSRWLLEKGYAYFQEFIPHEYETRITVVGDRAWGKLRFPYPNDFRASRDGRVSISPETIDSTLVSKAFDIAGHLESNSIAIDFLSKDKEAVITELTYTYGPVSPPYNGYWNRDIQWIGSKMKREEAQAEDFLARISAVHTNKR